MAWLRLLLVITPIWRSAAELSLSAGNAVAKKGAPHHSEDKLARQIIGKLNSEGDLHVLQEALIFDSVGVVVLLFVFSILRLIFPLVYQGNAEKAADGEDDKRAGVKHHAKSAGVGDVSNVAQETAELSPTWPPRPGQGIFQWIPATACASIDDVQQHVSLDAAMLLEFSNLAVKLTALIGLPMCLVMCPVNKWLGGKPYGEVDDLSSLSMANIQEGSWLYWVYAVIVWLVIHAAEQLIFHAQAGFLKRRYMWLKSLPAPRSTTVLVENLPRDLCSDAKLRKFFQDMFDHKAVRAVHVVRQTGNLLTLRKKLQEAEERQMEAELPRARSSAEVLERLEEEVARCNKEVEEERLRLQKAGEDGSEEDSCSTTAFVTFHKRKDAEIALRLQYMPDAEECTTSIPPEASDIRWEDLRIGPNLQAARERMGYLCVAGLYVGFAPLVLGVTSIADLEALKEVSPVVQKMLDAMPNVAVIIEGILASLALTLFMSFLPTIMMIIFDTFFVLKANSWAQAKLQVWYFWFQIVFTLLVTAVGSSIISVAEKIVERPMAVFGLLADTLPKASHFYLNFMVMQWVTHAMNLTRYINLVKFLMLRMLYGDKDAKKLSEPEDQDYYGVGSRSARWAVNLVIGLVFSSISPLICLLCCMNFLICRLVYGYLLVYAEIPKVDLGGEFFVRMLIHVQHGLVIYVALMVGVLYKHSATNGPAILAAISLAWMARLRYKFSVNMQWEFLPFSEIVNDSSFKKHKDGGHEYTEPEMGAL
mmetsp:Transcript_34794/g.63350  ORF Transcript_34794/g.63350 Transcript_34794/m.63350 type:complete len:761 (+) Transcript_34794:77-2359(+)